MRKLNAVLIACFALVFASAIRAQSTPGVNTAELNGNYVFTFTGISGSGGTSSVFAAVGRFTADGAGNLTNGQLDTNGVDAGGVLTAQAFTGTYAIGADHRGVMTFNIPGGQRTFAFAMMANGNAQFIQFDAAGGSGTIGSGTMEKVDTTAYSTAQITGDYAFGFAGQNHLNNRAAMVGRFTSNGAGTFTSAAGDLNAYATVLSMSFTTASYTVSDTATGRGTMNLAFSFGAVPASLNFVFYIVNKEKLFAMERDAVSTSTPLLNGVVLRQHTPAGGFSNASLDGNMVIYLTGICMTASGAAAKAFAGLLTADGNGALNLDSDSICGGPTSVTGVLGTYSVESNGRTSIAVGNGGVAYLVGSNQAVLFSRDNSVLFGFGEPQAAGSFTNSELQGTYAGFASTPATFGVLVFSGQFTADGASPTGNITGVEDIGAPSGPNPGAAFTATYSVSSSPTNGRGTMTVTSGSGETVAIYAISTSKFVGVLLSDLDSAIWIFEQSPPPGTPTPTLGSLTLNPTTVVGGVQSSTGTVSLSGPAPSGGAEVLLSSSNTGAAQVPFSVTVPTGATSATFAVTTTTVAASTSVTISASYDGVTQTASLAVIPPGVSSLTLNPTTVVGGVQSSTGTVTLSGSAPSGGAQVLLSSSNTEAAQVPFSVTVPAGATSATFAVTTTAVAASTSVTISASYDGVTQTASLTVVPPGVSSLTLNPTTVLGGAQSSTGRVTLNAPAPAGGAQVALSSSNTGAAQVPSSVTVPAGASSATFAVTSTAVAASTSVTISASYGGVTRTASLTVIPPSVSSLTLNPTTVVGGVQSSTGTVRLSGPAPAGGSQVLLSSSNTGAARVPSSVTVPAGATSATFTVNTSPVLFPTSVNISATYNGTTRTATLKVVL